MLPISAGHSTFSDDRDDDARARIAHERETWHLNRAQTERLNQLASDGRWPLTPMACSALLEAERLTDAHHGSLLDDRRGDPPVRELDVFAAEAVRTAIASVPEGLLSTHDIAGLRRLAQLIDASPPVTLGHRDMLELTGALNLVRNLRGSFDGALDEHRREVVRQHAQFAKWIHAAPDLETATRRQGVATAIVVAWARATSDPGMPTSLQIRDINASGGLPPSECTTEVLHDLPWRLGLSQGEAHPRDPEQFRRLAERLRISDLWCVLERGRLPEGLDISTLARIDVLAAPRGPFASEHLFVQLGTMPRLEQVTLPRGVVPSRIPPDWTFDAHQGRLRPPGSDPRQPDMRDALRRHWRWDAPPAVLDVLSQDPRTRTVLSMCWRLGDLIGIHAAEDAVRGTDYATHLRSQARPKIIEVLHALSDHPRLRDAAVESLASASGDCVDAYTRRLDDLQTIARCGTPSTTEEAAGMAIRATLLAQADLHAGWEFRDDKESLERANALHLLIDLQLRRLTGLETPVSAATYWHREAGLPADRPAEVLPIEAWPEAIRAMVDLILRREVEGDFENVRALLDTDDGIGQWLARQLDEDPWAHDRIRLLNERFAIDRTAAENEDQEADLWAAKEAAVKDLRMALLAPWTDKLRAAYL